MVVGPILPAKMPCNTHKYCGTRNIPRNILHSYKLFTTVESRVTATTPNIITCVFTLGPCGGYGHKLVARHACAHYRRDSAVNSVTMDAKWAVSNPSTASDAIVRREAPSLTMAANKIKTPGAVWSGLREWPRTTARRLSPWKRVGERDRNLYH